LEIFVFIYEGRFDFVAKINAKNGDAANIVRPKAVDPDNVRYTKDGKRKYFVILEANKVLYAGVFQDSNEARVKKVWNIKMTTRDERPDVATANLNREQDRCRILSYHLLTLYPSISKSRRT
jgi:hypothetical protein